MIPNSLIYVIIPSAITIGSPAPPTLQPELYKPIGCWKDTGNSAIPTLEGKDSRLTGSFSSRDYAIYLCYQSAKARGYHVFAVQSGGWCAGMRGTLRFKKYGKSTNCKNGKGGSMANDVYQIGGKNILMFMSPTL